MEVKKFGIQNLLTTKETEGTDALEFPATVEAEKVDSQFSLTTKETGQINGENFSSTDMGHFEKRSGGNFVACRNLIDFNLPESVPWRERLPEEKKQRLTSFEDMVREIVAFQDLWKSKKSSLDRNVVEEAHKKMLREFIHHINVEEGIGTQDKEAIGEIMSMVEESAGSVIPSVLYLGSTSKKTRVEAEMVDKDISHDILGLPDKKSVIMSMLEDGSEEDIIPSIRCLESPNKSRLVAEKVKRQNITANTCSQPDKENSKTEMGRLRNIPENMKRRIMMQDADKENVHPYLLTQPKQKNIRVRSRDEESIPRNTLHTQSDSKRNMGEGERYDIYTQPGSEGRVGEVEKHEINTLRTFPVPSQQPRRQITEWERNLRKNERETVNLVKAWRKLVKMAEEEKELDPSNSGLLELRDYIVEIHKTLMTGVIDENAMTPAGVFSTCRRKAEYKGKVHYYPTRESQEEWQRELWTMLDRYNGLIEETKMEMLRDREKGTACLFKCAAWLLFTLVSLHPFSDGNGRLCRLLASYSLSLVTPFPSSIYNIYSDTEKYDFLEALVNARDSSTQHPVHLAALMVESSWCAWKEFLDLVGLRRTVEDASVDSQDLLITKETNDLKINRQVCIISGDYFKAIGARISITYQDLTNLTLLKSDLWRKQFTWEVKGGFFGFVKVECSISQRSIYLVFVVELICCAWRQFLSLHSGSYSRQLKMLPNISY